MGLKAFTLIKHIKFFFNPLFFELISFQIITLAVKKVFIRVPQYAERFE